MTTKLLDDQEFQIAPYVYMCSHLSNTQIKFVYSEKATKFGEIFTLLLSTVHADKSKVKISPNFVVFSEYMNFNKETKWFEVAIES